MTSSTEESKNDSSSSTSAPAANDGNGTATTSDNTKSEGSMQKKSNNKKSALAKYTPRHPTASNPAKFGKADPKRDVKGAALRGIGSTFLTFYIIWCMITKSTAF